MMIGASFTSVARFRITRLLGPPVLPALRLRVTNDCAITSCCNEMSQKMRDHFDISAYLEFFVGVLEVTDGSISPRFALSHYLMETPRRAV